MQAAFEGIDVIEGEESEAFRGEDDFILYDGAPDQIVGHDAC